MTLSWKVYFSGPTAEQRKLIGQVSETRMREILAGPGLNYGASEIAEIFDEGKFSALFNVEFEKGK